MKYIVGLGNPGKEHAGQRHNVGWVVADYLVNAFNLSEPVRMRKYAGLVSTGSIAGEAVTLLYPETYMNHSGTAVRKLVPKGEETDLILIYDDVDIPLGECKLSFGRGDGGHNGVKSVIATLGTKDFIRLRVGIAPQPWFGSSKRPTGDALPAYVLGNFKKNELKQVVAAAPRLCDIITSIVTEGVTKAMNAHN